MSRITCPFLFSLQILFILIIHQSVVCQNITENAEGCVSHGLQLRDKNDADSSLYYFAKAKRMFFDEIQQIGDTDNESISTLSKLYNNIGYVSSLMGQLDSAIHYYQKSLSFLTKSQDSKISFIQVFDNLSDAYFQHMQFEQSADFQEKAITLLKDEDSLNAEEMKDRYHTLSITYRNNQDSVKALYYLKLSVESIMVNSLLTSPESENIICNLAQTYVQWDSSSQAARLYYVLFSNDFVKKSSPERAINYALHSGHLYLKNTEWKLANLSFVQASHFLSSHPQLADSSAISIHESLGFLYKKMNLVDSAIFYYRKLNEILSKSGNYKPEKRLHTCLILGQLLEENSQWISAIEIYENALEAYQHGANYAEPIYLFGSLLKLYIRTEQVEKLVTLSMALLEDTLVESAYSNISELAMLYFNLGEYLYDYKKYDKALKLYLHILNLAVSPDKKMSERLYNRLGQIYLYYGYYEIAEKYIKKNVDKHSLESSSDSVNLSISYNLYSSIELALANYNEALEYVNAAFNLIAHNDSSLYEKVAILTNLAGIYLEQGYYHQALKVYNQTLDLIPAKEKNYGLTLNVFNSLSQLYLKMGNHYDALRYADTAISFANSLKIKLIPELAEVYNTLGMINYHIGEYGEAIKNYSIALEISKINPKMDFNIMISLYNNIGTSYIQENEYKKAYSFFEIARKITSEEFGSASWKMAVIYTNIAKIFKQKMEYTKASEYFSNAIQIFQNTKKSHTSKIATLMNNIGELALEQGDVEGAKNYLFKSKNLFESDSLLKNPSSANLFNNIAMLYLRLKNTDSAKVFLTKAFNANVSQGNIDSMLSAKEVNLTWVLSKNVFFESLIGLGEAYYDDFLNHSHLEKDLMLSHQTFEKAFSVSDDMRKNYISNESTLYLSNNNKLLYSDAIGVCLALERLHPGQYFQAAYETMEKCKSITMLEQYYRQHATHYADIPDSILAIETHLKLNLTRINNQIIKNAEKPVLNEEMVLLHNEEYRSLNSQYNSLLQLLEKKYHGYYNLKYNAQVVPLDSIKKNLKANEMMLDYFIGKQYLYICCITNQHSETLQIPLDSNFSETLTLFYNSIKKIESNEFSGYANSIYKILIKPIESKFSNISSLIILPDDYLWYVPFECLGTKLKTNSMNFSDYDFLIKRFDFTYSFSASYWQLATKTTSGQKAWAGFAPVFKNSTKDEPHKNRVSLTALPFSEKEVDNIFTLYKSKNIPAKAFLHQEANLSNFKDFADKDQIIHIATHGVYNNDQPELSGLYFYENSSAASEPQGVGLLNIDDLYNLRISSDLVVLSACESGLGKLVRGEGLLSLTRAFISKGAKNVLYSLWKISDKQTSELMLQFYKNIIAGDGYSVALRKAKLSLISSKESAFPYYWAGFILNGK